MSAKKNKTKGEHNTIPNWADEKMVSVQIPEDTRQLSKKINIAIADTNRYFYEKFMQNMPNTVIEKQNITVQHIGRMGNDYTLFITCTIDYTHTT